MQIERVVDIKKLGFRMYTRRLTRKPYNLMLSGDFPILGGHDVRALPSVATLDEINGQLTSLMVQGLPAWGTIRLQVHYRLQRGGLDYWSYDIWKERP